MSNQLDKAKALLLPADGSEIRLVSYNIIVEKSDEDVVDNGMAEFFDPIPDLKPWLVREYKQRAMTIFCVDSRRRQHHDPVAKSFIESKDTAAHGQYCLYYNLSQALPLNKTCKRIVNIEPPSDRLFWRGDVLVVRYESHLGLGHEYKDVDEALLNAVEVVLRKAYETQGLERVHEEWESSKREEAGTS
jgi:hypothetical protein